MEDVRRARVLINIDDDVMARAGVRLYLLSVDPSLDVSDMSFADAYSRTDWAGVDWVVVDLSQPNFDALDADEYPGIGVVAHIRRHGAGRGPYVALVTGEFVKSQDPMVLRRAVEAGADYLQYRSDFAANAPDMFAPSGPSSAVKRAEQFAGWQEPGLGVTSRSRLNDGLTEIQSSGLLSSKRRGGVGNKLREIIAKEGRFARVDAHGTPKDGIPNTEQVRSLFRRAARLGE